MRGNRESALPDLHALWNFDDPAATEATFRALLPAVRASGIESDHAQLLTQIARAEGLQRRFDDAHRTLDDAASLVKDGMVEARVRLLLERGRVFNSSGRRDEAKPRFVEAWEAARAARLEALAIDAVHMIAIVEPPERAIEWNERALELAEQASEPRARAWRGSLLNNLGWAYHGRSEFSKALDAFERALAARREGGAPAPIRIARWCVARCLRSLGRVEEALGIQEALRREGEVEGANDGFVFEEIGECLLALGRTAEARPFFARAHGLLSRDAWLAANEPERLARLHDLGRPTPVSPPVLPNP